VSDIVLGPVSWERMIGAVEKVRERLLRAAAALEQAGIPYAVVGGNAVAAWVSRVDESAVRNTPNVEILIRRSELDRAVSALIAAGFVYRNTASNALFLDCANGKARDAVGVVLAGEKYAPSISRLHLTLRRASPQRDSESSNLQRLYGWNWRHFTSRTTFTFGTSLTSAFLMHRGLTGFHPNWLGGFRSYSTIPKASRQTSPPGRPIRRTPC
jgi:hypothetical protein